MKPTGCYKLLLTGCLGQSIRERRLTGQLIILADIANVRLSRRSDLTYWHTTLRKMLSSLIVFKIRLIVFHWCECANKDVLNVAIDFLITLSLLNNQATANALVITIHSTYWKRYNSQGHSVLCHCVLHVHAR